MTIMEGDNLNEAIPVPKAIDLDTEKYTDTKYRLLQPRNGK